MSKKLSRTIKLIVINTLTILRLIGAFILPFIYKNYGSSVVSAVVILLFLTDAIDGFLARKLNASTYFGCIMDAASDKLLNAISFIILGLSYNIMFTPVVIEIAILYTVYSTYRYGGNVQSSYTGKVKTAIVDIVVVLSFLILSLPLLKSNSSYINYVISNTEGLTYIFAFIMIISELIALIDYMNKNHEARINPKAMEIKYEEKNRKPWKLIKKQLFDTNYYLEHKNESIMKQLYKK